MEKLARLNMSVFVLPNQKNVPMNWELSHWKKQRRRKTCVLVGQETSGLTSEMANATHTVEKS